MSGIDFAAVDEDGVINWTKAKAAGLDFCYLNATPGNSVWGQAGAARDAGITVGPYIFPTITASQNPGIQMDISCSLALATYLPQDLPFCLDIELPHGIAGTGLTRQLVCAWFLAAYGEMEQRVGHQPLGYSSVRVLDTTDSDTLGGGLNSLADRMPLWLDRYDGQMTTNAPVAWGTDNYWIHQSAGDARNMYGIRQVDLDYWNYLRPGAHGNRVKWLQEKLMANVDGVFGPGTKALLQGKQLIWNLEVDGIVGPKTFARLSKL